MASHPIGMDYRYTALNKSQFYFYPSRDQKRIRLFNGKLGCGSCHSLYAQTKNNLVAGFDNDNSELCLKCHNL